MLTRRTFLKTTGLPVAGACMTSNAMRAEATAAPRYFLLESYLLKNGSQGQRLATYMQNARIGMAGRLQTAAPALVLEALVAAHMPQVLVVSAFAALDDLVAMKRKLRQDAVAREALAQWEAGDEVPYEQLNEIVLEAADYCPPLLLPEANAQDKPPRVFELRTYHSPTERQLRALQERFAGP